MSLDFLQCWHKHYTPKFASVLLIRSQIIPLSHLSVPRFCYYSVILPSTSLVSCSVWKLFTLSLFSYLQSKLSFFVSNMLCCASCMIGRKSLNHFSINILLCKCRDTVLYEEVTVQIKGEYGFTAFRLFPVQQTLLVQSAWRSFPLPKFSAYWFLQSHRMFF